MARPRVTIEAPPVTPLPFGLFSAAQVVDDGSPHWGLGFQYETDHCGAATVWSEDFCYNPPPPETFPDLTFALGAGTSGGTIVSVGALAAGAYTVTVQGGTPVVVNHPGGVFAGTITIGTPQATYEVRVDSGGPNPYWEVPSLAPGETETVPNTGEADTGPSKTATDGLAGLVEGDPFAVYHLLNCRMPGGGWQEGEERARNALRLGEQRAVESALWAQMVNAESTGLGGGVHPVDGVALLEAFAAENYGGVPTLHIPRGLTTVLSTYGTVGRYGTRLETTQGAVVASGGGYPGSLESTRIYVSGQTVVRRSPNIQVEPAPDLATNDFSALAERVYATTWECTLAYVDVSASFYMPPSGGPQ